MAALLTSMAIFQTACTRGSDATKLPIDLIGQLPQAERRAAGSIEDAIRAEFANVDGSSRPVLVMRAPARVIWPLRFSRQVVFRARVTLMPDDGSSAVTVRVGISDDRTYEELLRMSLLEPGWRSADVDLSAYSGWKWSLFYQPARKTWRLVLNADATPGGTAAWAEPRVEASPAPRARRARSSP